MPLPENGGIAFAPAPPSIPTDRARVPRPSASAPKLAHGSTSSIDIYEGAHINDGDALRGGAAALCRSHSSLLSPPGIAITVQAISLVRAPIRMGRCASIRLLHAPLDAGWFGKLESGKSLAKQHTHPGCHTHCDCPPQQHTRSARQDWRPASISSYCPQRDEQ